MPIAVIAQFAALALTLIIGVCAISAIFEIRKSQADQLTKLDRTVKAVEGFQKLQPELMTLLQRIDSDGQALQQIAIQIEAAVASLKDGVDSSVNDATNRQTAAIERLYDHLDSQEERLARILEGVSEHLRPIPQAEPKQENTPVHLRREVIGQDAHLRFSVLKEWISINTLAILRRASREWNTANDLIATIPPYLEAEAEILGGRVLLIGTRGLPEKLALPIRDLDTSSDVSEWFDVNSNGYTTPNVPAVLTRSNGNFKLVSKGTNSGTGH